MKSWSLQNVGMRAETGIQLEGKNLISPEYLFMHNRLMPAEGGIGNPTDNYASLVAYPQLTTSFLLLTFVREQVFSKWYSFREKTIHALPHLKCIRLVSERLSIPCINKGGVNRTNLPVLSIFLKTHS